MLPVFDKPMIYYPFDEGVGETARVIVRGEREGWAKFGTVAQQALETADGPGESK
jgi:hypothetical protein